MPTIDSSAAPLDTALGRCGVALQAPSAQQRDVIDALRAAYGLESALYERGDSAIGREEVYAHYRQGFSEQLAKDLTDYSWEPVLTGRLRATHRALAVPDSVGVLELSDDRAVVAWIPPTSFRETWGLPRCMVDRVEREGGRWIIQAREP